MTKDPFHRFLGVSASADALTVLGLSPQQSSPAEVDAALRARLASVYNHPDGRSDEAERVRRALREAAASLTQSLPRVAATMPQIATRGLPPQSLPAAPSLRPPAPARAPVPSRQIPIRPSIALTDFDRHVLAVLVGSGGWSAESRARLVALAEAHGVTVLGLIKVVNGLSEYARAGGARLGVAEITAGQPRVLPPILPTTGGFIDTAWIERYAPELREGSTRATVKLSIFFALLVILAGSLALPVLFRSSSSGRTRVAAVNPQPTPTTNPATTDNATATAAAEAPPPLALFKQPPTFTAPVPDVATKALVEAKDLPARFDGIARRLLVADEPSAAVYRDWTDAVQIAGAAWMQLGEAERLALDRAAMDVLVNAARGETSDRLLADLIPPRANEPIDLWRGAWFTAMLSQLSRHTVVAQAVRDRAAAHLAVALGDDAERAAGDHVAAASAWLNLSIPRLVELTEVDDEVYAFWELWLRAQQNLSSTEQFSAALMSAIGAIMRSQYDLSQPGPSANVLGRLVTAADLKSSPAAKQAMHAFFDDQQNIESNDLWVLTSMMSQYGSSGWFEKSFVLPANADWIMRNRVRDQIESAWPEFPVMASAAAGIGVQIDAPSALRWAGLLDQLTKKRLTSEPGEMMRHLVALARLNEAAAAFAAGERAAAASAMDRSEAASAAADAPATGPAAMPPGNLTRILVPGTQGAQAVGADGTWADAYQQAGKDVEARLELLRSLRRSAGGDLGPVDAEVFIREVYRGTPKEVRSLAQTIAMEVFANGPNVVLELLDQLPDAGRNASVSDMIAQVTGRPLPPVRSDAWPAQSRLALVETSLRLRAAGSDAVDSAAATLAESMQAQLAMLNPSAAPPSMSSSPEQAASALAEAWIKRAESMMVADPLPGSLDTLQRRDAVRRRLAEGPTQQLVAARLQSLELLMYITTAEQPALRPRVARIFSEAAQRRALLTSAIAQAVDIEQTIAVIWQLRMNAFTGPPPAEEPAA